MARLSIYLDSSVVVPLFLPDAFAARAEAFLLSGPVGLVVSDFVSAEFASIVGIRVRVKMLKTSDARAALSNFDSWSSQKTRAAETAASDVRSANIMLRRLDLTLRAPDAINLAIAQRLNANLATFDIKMGACARTLGMPVVRI